MARVTIEEAQALVAHRQDRLARARKMGRPGHVAKCQENLDAAIWTLRHAEQRSNYPAPFQVGDRVYAHSPVNESWNPEYTATVTGVRGERIDVRWDHGPSNSGHDAADFALRPVSDPQRRNGE